MDAPLRCESRLAFWRWRWPVLRRRIEGAL